MAISNRSPVFCLVIALFLAMIWPLIAFSADIRPDHPRLLIRADGGGDPHTVTFEMLKKKADDPRFEQFRKRLRRSKVNYAMRAIVYDDAAAADTAIAMLITPNMWSGTTWDGIRVMWKAFVFDWLYNHPNFDDWEKAMAVEQLIADSERLYDTLQDGIHLFHTRMYAWTTGLAAAGYALTGHYEDAGKFINWANDYYKNDLLPARRLLGGSVHNGFGYGRHYIMWLVGHYLSIVYTATGEDLWSEIRRNQDDWTAREAQFIIYGRQPDGLMAKFGDCYRRTSERFSFRVISERNWFYHEPVFQGHLKSLLEEQPVSVFEIGNDYIAYLYYEPDRPSASVNVLPPKTMFGPHGTGMVIWRSGWDPGDLWIFFKCGDYFGNHGHYDQGHLDIFLGTPLLAEAGAYAGGYNSDFRLKFYRTSYSHNTLLVLDPENPDDEGGQRVYVNQSHKKMESYLADKDAECGNILIHEPGERVNYLLADLTGAYPGTRVERLTRELALVDDRYLVVRDKVILTNSRYLPKVLWHCMTEPVLEEKGFTLRRGGGKISLQVLSPQDASIEWVRGFRVGTRTFDIEIDTTYNDPGVGRVEIVGKTGRREQTFLQVLDIAPETSPKGLFSTVQTSEGTMIRLPGDRVLLLKEAGAVLK